MAELISEAAGRYDQVIFDGPPVLLVSDALVLASVVDGVIMVCRAKSASHGVIQRAREQLEQVNARIFGAVLNAARTARGGYFREQMRSYYDYQPEEALLTNGTRALPGESGDNKGDSRP
jgi:Mrp family chromosome partitioning ATPase